MKQGFIIVCTACVLLSLWLSQYIPADIFDKIVSPLLFAGTVAVAFFGAFLVFKHAEGMRMRKAWGWALLVWGIADSFYILGWALAPSQVMDIGAHNLTTYELLVGNVLGWVLLLYPTEALRPGWLSFRHVLWHLLPMFLLVALDYVFPFNLRFLISLYPFVLIAFLISHVKAYRTWCEENFSTLEDIDVQWLVRYLWMVVMVGGLYLYICLAHHPSRGFTQLWFTIFMFAYSTEQILYRKDPWEMVRRQEKTQEAAPEAGSSPANSELRQKLDRWMEQEKPYVNPAFQLADLRAEGGPAPEPDLSFPVYQGGIQLHFLPVGEPVSHCGGQAPETGASGAENGRDCCALRLLFTHGFLQRIHPRGGPFAPRVV